MMHLFFKNTGSQNYYKNQFIQPQKNWGVVPVFAMAMLLFPPAVPQLVAQIIPDATLPNNSLVSTQGETLTIDGGTVVGDRALSTRTVFLRT